MMKPETFPADLELELLKKAYPFMLANLRPAGFSPAAASFGNGESDNWPVQCTAKAFSAFAALGDREHALPLLRYLLATHISGRRCCCDGKKWGHTWIAAGGSLERMMSAVRHLDDALSPADRKALRRVFLSEADWILRHLPVEAGIDASLGHNKPESNLWNAGILIRTALYYPDAPHADEYRKKGEVLLVNGISTPADADPRKVGANFTDNLSLDHHNYLNTGYMVICLLHVAILHYDCRMLGAVPPPELYRHVAELWQLVKSCIAPDGRLLRIGGDTRIRYAYCQSYLPAVCRFAADFLRDPEAAALGDAALRLLAREQAANLDGSFFSARLAEIRRISPLYHLRCEADVLNVLALRILWRASAAGGKAAKIPLLREWQDGFHGAKLIRTDRVLRSWVCRAASGPAALCVPLDRSDLAEWLHNLAGEIRVFGRCRAVELRRHPEGDAVCLELVWQTEPPFPEGVNRARLVRQTLAFALVPDGRTVLAANRMTALKDFNAEGGDGIDLRIPNDFFNGFRRTYTGVGSDRVNVDGAISLLLLGGAKRKLRVTRAKKPNLPISSYPYFSSLRADAVGLPVGIRSVRRGELLADCVYAAVADSPAAELPRFEGRAERTGTGWAVRWHDPASGRVWNFTVDFDALTARLEAETARQ